MKATTASDGYYGSRTPTGSKRIKEMHKPEQSKPTIQPEKTATKTLLDLVQLQPSAFRSAFGRITAGELPRPSHQV